MDFSRLLERKLTLMINFVVPEVNEHCLVLVELELLSDENCEFQKAVLFRDKVF
jgi:hypothetical protein